jgi:hypothetical protein
MMAYLSHRISTNQHAGPKKKKKRGKESKIM